MRKALSSDQKQEPLPPPSPIGREPVQLVQRVQLFWITQCPNIVRNLVTRAKTVVWCVLRDIKLFHAVAWKSLFDLVFRSLICNFGFAELTPVRKNSNNIWFFAHLFVTLQTEKSLFNSL